MKELWGCLCFVVWISLAQSMPVIFRNTHLHGGKLMPDVITLEGCLFVCAEYKCNGFDFNHQQSQNPQSGSCWLYNDDAECGLLQTKPRCDHYRFVDCSGSDFEDLSSLVHFPNNHGLGGTFVSGMDSLRQCYTYCKEDTVCKTFDWDARFSACWIHGSSTSCRTLQEKEGCTHYRLKTDCSDECSGYTFKDFYGYNRPDGVQIASQVSYDQCKLLCDDRAACKMVDYDIFDQTCWEHTTKGSPVANSCCRHAAKVCADYTSPSPLTTRPPTRAPTTDKGFTPVPNIIPDRQIDTSGKCPSELQSFDNTRRIGGDVVRNVLTIEACRDWCLDPLNMCYAVDFNSKTSSADRCYAHAAVFPDTDLDVEKDDCCTQFRKVSCAFKMCIVHIEKDVTSSIVLGPLQTLYTANEQEVNINPNDIGTLLDPSIYTLVPCEGSCMVTNRYAITSDGNPDVYQPQYMTRSCNPFIPPTSNPNKQCSNSRPPANTAGEVVNSCTCTGDKCNAFGNTITRDCIAHYPLDCNTFDLTENKRNGEAYNLEYDGTDVAKNWSARFTGRSFVQVNGLKTILLGSLGEAPNYEVGPYFTVSLWFKLSTVTNTDMTLLSNGVRGVASLEIYTLPVDGDQRMMVGTIKIDGTHYTVIRNANYDLWYNLMLMVTVNPVQDVYSLKMYLTPQGGSPVEAETLTDISRLRTNADLPKIQQLNNPLCIGKQYVPTDPEQPFSISSPGDFYVGLMDEIYFFGNSLSAAQRNSVRGVSYDPRRFSA